MRAWDGRIGKGNAEVQRTQSSDLRVTSALSASSRFNLFLTAEQQQAIKANLKGLGYGI
jgi:hypothetical protein